MKRILVIEDEIAYLRLLQDQLIENGYEVIAAKDGKEGLVKAQLLKPDLILLDIKMPVMNGLDMLDELRKDEYGKLVKVFILTNLEPDDEILIKVLKEQPTYYLIKSDINLGELIEKIKDVFSK